MRSALPLLLLAATASAGEFPGNHLFVCAEGSDLVIDYAPNGQPVWQLGQGTGLSAPAGLAFGADGLLYVASSGSDCVLAFDAGGNVVRTLGAGVLSAPRGVAIGPDGSVHVGNSTGTIERFAPTGAHLGSLGGEAGLDQPTDLAFGADGHLFVACAGSSRVLELDAGGALVRELDGAGALGEAAALALGPDGRLAVATGDGDTVVRLDAEGSAAATQVGNGTLLGPAGLAFGPDGLLYVMAREGAGILAIDAEGAVQRTLSAAPGLQDGGALAFAPRRFAVTVKGSLRSADGATLALTETGTLTLAAGTATIFLRLEDGADGNDLASVFGGDTVALRGFAAAQGNGKKWRLAATAGAPVCASLAAEMSGSVGAQGLWLAASAKGDVWRAGAAGSFRGTFKTGAALP